jgi:hypothetical protein
VARDTDGKKRTSARRQSPSRTAANGVGATVGATSDDQGGAQADSGPDLQRTSRQRAARRTEQLLVLSLAILFALAGFPLHGLWIGAIVLMALLWGYMASELNLGSSRRGGVVSDMVTTIADEARDLKDEVSDNASGIYEEVLEGSRHSTDGDDSGGSGIQTESRDLQEATKKELYDQAREADIEGRSSMTKDELKEALDE